MGRFRGVNEQNGKEHAPQQPPIMCHNSSHFVHLLMICLFLRRKDIDAVSVLKDLSQDICLMYLSLVLIDGHCLQDGPARARCLQSKRTYR